MEFVIGSGAIEIRSCWWTIDCGDHHGPLGSDWSAVGAHADQC